jgi:myosin-3
MAPGLGMTNNLAELEDLNEDTLLSHLEARFKRKQIYSYVGEILVSMNPFERFPELYSPEMMTKYSRIGDKSKLDPHVFALADTAYATMTQSSKNQVCVISGESGAGKTEAAKSFVKQLVNVSNGAEFEGLENKLLEVNPVLEAFGNAKTKFNDNSSRFGKYTSVVFNSQGQVKGANMIEYLLEKSRVISQNDCEQNFHVFYLAYIGYGDEAKYALGDIEDHRYTESNGDATSAARNKETGFFAVEFQELRDCFDTIGFEPEQTEDLFHTVSGIIHLGDLEFDGGDEANIVSEESVLHTICEQLGVDEVSVQLAMTRQMLSIAGEEVERKLSEEKANDVRDATAKSITSKSSGGSCLYATNS